MVPELEKFEEMVPMTTHDRKLLYKWAEEGHSPFTNPFGFVSLDNGRMLNFVEALNLKPEIENDIKTGFGSRYSKIITIEEMAVPNWKTCVPGENRVKG